MNCSKCQRQMSDPEPLWYSWVYLGLVQKKPPWPVAQRGFRWTRHYLCSSCVEDKDEQEQIESWRLPDGRIVNVTTPIWKTKPCEVCKRPIYCNIEHDYRPRACSIECRKVLQTKRRKEWRKERAKWIIAPRQRECRQCRKVFIQKREDAQFCSTSCRQKAYRTRKMPQPGDPADA